MKDIIKDLIDGNMSQREACRRLGIARITLSSVLLKYIKDNKI